MKKSILFVMPNLGGGGGERVITHIANHLDRNKFIIKILLVKRSNHVYLKNLKDDVEVIKMDIETRIRYAVFKVLKQIIKVNPDIVFMGMSGLNAFMSIAVPFFKKYKWVARETNILSLITKSYFKYLYYIFYKYDLTISQSDDMRDDLIKNFGIKSSKLIKINNPVDSDFIDEKLNKNSVVDLPQGKINLISCGRLTYQKGFDNLIKEFSVLKDKEKYHLSILGSGNHLDKRNQEKVLRKLLIDNDLEDSITFVGFQENSYKWFEKADVFILSSRFEGFPNVLLEALYCGTPALVNNCQGGINEIMIEGKNGFIFDFKKTGDFEEKLNIMGKAKFKKKEVSDTIRARYGLKKIMTEYEKSLWSL